MELKKKQQTALKWMWIDKIRTEMTGSIQYPGCSYEHFSLNVQKKKEKKEVKQKNK